MSVTFPLVLLLTVLIPIKVEWIGAEFNHQSSVGHTNIESEDVKLDL